MSRLVGFRDGRPIEIEPFNGLKFTHKELKRELGGPPVIIDLYKDRRSRCILGNADSLGDESMRNANASVYCGTPINGDFLVIDLHHFDEAIFPRYKFDGIRLLPIEGEIETIPFDITPLTPSQIEKLLGADYNLIAVADEQDYVAGLGGFNRTASIELGWAVNGTVLAILQNQWIAPKHIHDQRIALTALLNCND